MNFSTIVGSNANACPARAAIGVATVSLNLPLDGGRTIETVPVFNLVPARGEPARFGFEAAKVPVILDTAVRTGSEYGVTVTVSNATQLGQLLGTQLTLWGEPESASHDNSRGWSCLREEEENGESCAVANEFIRSQTPFLTLPTACGGPLSTILEGESWPLPRAGRNRRW